MKYSDFEFVNDVMFLLVQGRDFANLSSFVREHLGFNPIISKSCDGVIIIDSGSGRDVVFIPFRSHV
jgi:hypothetical protein